MAKKKAVVGGDELHLSRAEQLEIAVDHMVTDKLSFKKTHPNDLRFQSTGSAPVDFLIGQTPDRLGIPLGRVIDVWGPRSGGKTGFALEIGAAFQAEGGFVVIVSSEGLDGNYAVNICGLDIGDMNRFAFYESSTLEGAWGIIETVVKKFHTASFPVLVIWDSVSACGVKNEQLENKDTTDTISSAANAKFLHNAFRRGILTYLTGSKVTLLCIRHETAGVRAFAPAATTHGSAIDFHSWLSIHIRRKQMDLVNNKLVGYFRILKCTKSKVGVDRWEHHQPIYNGYGRDEGKEALLFLKLRKALTQKGAHIEIDGTSMFEKNWIERYHDYPEWKQFFDDWVLSILAQEFDSELSEE